VEYRSTKRDNTTLAAHTEQGTRCGHQ